MRIARACEYLYNLICDMVDPIGSPTLPIIHGGGRCPGTRTSVLLLLIFKSTFLKSKLKLYEVEY